MKKAFGYYTRKPQFLSSGTSFEAAYLPVGQFPDNLNSNEWVFRGMAAAPKSASVAELKRAQIFRGCPANVDPRLFWPQLS
jgi:hypothetical protein